MICLFRHRRADRFRNVIFIFWFITSKVKRLPSEIEPVVEDLNLGKNIVVDVMNLLVPTILTNAQTKLRDRAEASV